MCGGRPVLMVLAWLCTDQHHLLLTGGTYLFSPVLSIYVLTPSLIPSIYYFFQGFISSTYLYFHHSFVFYRLNTPLPTSYLCIRLCILICLFLSISVLSYGYLFIYVFVYLYSWSTILTFIYWCNGVFRFILPSSRVLILPCILLLPCLCNDRVSTLKRRVAGGCYVTHIDFILLVCSYPRFVRPWTLYHPLNWALQGW